MEEVGQAPLTHGRYWLLFPMEKLKQDVKSRRRETRPSF